MSSYVFVIHLKYAELLEKIKLCTYWYQNEASSINNKVKNVKKMINFFISLATLRVKNISHPRHGKVLIYKPRDACNYTLIFKDV